MGTKIAFGVAAILVCLSGVVGYAAHPKNTLPDRAPKVVSAQRVISDIQNQQLQQDKVAKHFRIIHLANAGSEGFAFVSFDVDGNRKYASLVLSPNGFVMSTFSPSIRSESRHPSL
ncbi:MAG: hypothetical protein K6T83_05985 [Alicyclobacillus sp.]|nr:hypothetical protein [Alicyclobacillus sp.]